MNYILSKDSNIDLAKMGGKAASLVRMQKSGYSVPECFIVSPQAFIDSLNAVQKKLLEEEKIDNLFEKFKLSTEVKKQIKQALVAFGLKSTKLVIRASGLIETGEFESFQNVNNETILDNIIAIWQSALSKQPDPLFIAPAVIVQRMIQPKASGLALSVDPVNPQSKNIVISAVSGPADKLITGKVNGDNYYLTRKGKIEINHLEHDVPVLTDKEKKAIVKLAIKIEEYFKAPQDMEWAIEDEQIYLLKSRPIATLPSPPERNGTAILWDNNNVENYSGLVLPLSFSFASRVYTIIAQKLLAIMGTSRKTVEDNSVIYKNSLGYINGRIYYNLFNCHRTLDLLPGCGSMRKLTEDMLGVVEVKIAEDSFNGGASRDVSLIDKLKSWYDLSIASLKLIYRFIFLQKNLHKFECYVDQILDLKESNIENMELDQLELYYLRLEQTLLNDWNLPLINDLFSRILFGFSRKLLIKFCGKKGEELHNSFLKAEEDESVKRIKLLAKIAANDPELLAALASQDSLQIMQQIAENKEFKKLYDQYLVNFSDHWFKEVKFESLTLAEDQLILHNTIYHFATIAEKQYVKVGGYSELAKLLSHSRMKLWFAKWVMAKLQSLVKNKENFSLKRNILLGTIRKIFLAMGKKLNLAKKINNERDIFYLEINEIIGFIEGNVTLYNLAEIVKLRKTQQEQFSKLAEPDHRFFTYGPVGLDIHNIYNSLKIQDHDDSKSKKGLGCVPGVIRGKIRLITNPKIDLLNDEEIMVAKFTAPSWLMLFASAKGVLVERGDLLSSSAMLAREMGVPAIVSVPGLTNWLKTGDEVEFDGASGVISKIG